MRISFAPAFLKALDKLDPQVKAGAKEAVGKVIDFYERRLKAPGLGVKRLRGRIWEARADLKIRVLYLLQGDELRFVLAGTHDDVRKFLSRV
jgi:mRNA-degrading endonuclease RelE of RelBE toxin-antitoxin system